MRCCSSNKRSLYILGQWMLRKIGKMAWLCREGWEKITKALAKNERAWFDYWFDYFLRLKAYWLTGLLQPSGGATRLSPNWAKAHCSPPP
jgi:hypothetical protein